MFSGSNVIVRAMILLNFVRVFLIVTPELVVAALCVIIAKRIKSKNLYKYGRNKALAIDLWGNAELWGNPYQTISSRLGMAYGKERYWWVAWIRGSIDYYALKIFDDPDHCLRAAQAEIPPHAEHYEIWSWIDPALKDS